MLRIAGSGGGGGCFPAGVRVLTPDGEAAIESLKPGDEVLSFDDTGRVAVSVVQKLHVHPLDSVLRVRYWGGELRVTANHWVLNQYNSFVEIGTLTEHDTIVDQLGHLRPILEFIPDGEEPVYNLTVTPDHTFIAGGIRVHNGGRGLHRPLITGSGGGGGDKGGGGGGHVPVESTDSLLSRQYAKVIDLISEGEIGGLVNGLQSVFLNDTPIQNSDTSYNFTGVTVVTRNGTQSQSAIPGFTDTESEQYVSTEVKQAVPLVRSVVSPNVSAVRVTVAIPRLTYQEPTTGDLGGTTVQFAIDLQSNGGGFNPQTFDGSTTITISGKTTSRYRKSFYIPLTGSGPWDIRVRRITADSTQSNLANQTWWDSYTEVIESRLRYPNSALTGLEISAEQFQSIPTRGYEIYGMLVKVPTNYDPVTRVYTGIWDGTFKVVWTDNPAWIYYDLATNPRYGLGDFVDAASVNKWALYEIAMYCDTLVPDGYGGMEPRFTCNLYMQTREDANSVMSSLSSVFRGMTYWAASQLVPVADMPRDAEALFTAANVIDGMFNYSGSSKKARHTVALVSWNDPADRYRQKVEYVDDEEGIAKWGVVEAPIVAFACTSRGQAHRLGKWLIYTERMETQTVTFKCGLDASRLSPGAIIKVADPARAGVRLAGRIAYSDVDNVTLDAPVTIEAGVTYTLTVMLPDGSIEEQGIVNTPGDNQTTMLMLHPLTQNPLPSAIWMLTSSVVVPQTYRTLNVVEHSPLEYEVTALISYPQKFADVELGIKFEPLNTISPSLITPAAPLNVSASDNLYSIAPFVVGIRTTLSWEGTASSYEITVNVPNKNPRFLKSYSPTIDVEGLDEGPCTFYLVSINSLGRRSAATAFAYIVQGKDRLPSDVQNFTVAKASRSLELKWSNVPDLDLLDYEIREGQSWDSGVLVGRIVGDYTSVTRTEAGTYNFHIRARDTSLNYSNSATLASITLTAPASVTGFDAIQYSNRVELRWNTNSETDLNGYEVREGAAWGAGVYLGETKGSNMTLPAGAAGTRTFWIKAIEYPGIYSDVAVFVTTDIAQSSSANVIWSVNEKAGGFTGVKYKTHVNGGNLVLDDDIAYGEYLFNTDLLAQYRASNTMFTGVAAIQDTNITWATATFTWDSVAAQMPWVSNGDTAQITVRFQIAPFIGLGTGELDGWGLNNTLTSINGVAPSASAGITYGDGRYTHGVRVADTTVAAWAVSVPAQFRYSLWLTPDQITAAAIASFTGTSGKKLSLRYSAALARLILEDNLGSTQFVPITLAAGDRVLVCIEQNAASRSLFAGIHLGTPVQSVEAFAPVGAFTGLAFA